MAYVYSTAQTDTTHGNIDMSINIFRGDCTRTQTTATFSFGVRFTPNGETKSNGGRGTRTSNSIAAWYGGVQRFAQASSGNVTASKGTYYYAYYTDRTSPGHVNVNNTTETTCFTATITGLSATTASVSITIGVGWADYAGTKKGELTFKLSIPEYHGTVGKGTVSITDNYNNTFTLKGTKGASGINNPSTGPTLKWGYDTRYSNTFTNNSNIVLTIVTNSQTDATRPIYAKSITGATYGNDQTAFAQLDVRQYVGPSAPGKPVISYNKNRLTTKENWLFTWTSATKTNDSSPVKGYRIRLYRKRGNSDFVKLPIYGSDGKYLSTKVVSSGDIYYDRAGNYLSVYIYPAYYSKDIHPDEPDILPGDQIKLAVSAYTQYGKDNTGNQLFRTGEVFSDVSTIQNAGIMRVKVGGAWKEGQVYIKVGGAWKEAEVVQTKVNGDWKESE